MRNREKKPASPRNQTQSPSLPADRPDSLLDQLLTDSEQPPTKIEGVVVGQLIGFETSGMPLVDFDLNPSVEPLVARSTEALTNEHISREVALLFEQGNPRQPIVIGLMWQPEEKPADPNEPPNRSEEKSIKVSADGERLTLTAEREIVLRCGKGSLTLTRAGKILLRGMYVLSHSTGVNRIRGGSVQIN